VSLLWSISRNRIKLVSLRRTVKPMFKGLLVLVGLGIAAYFLLKPKRVSGSVTALYSDVKVSSPPMPSPGDSAQNALIGPSTYNY
jgi:hypothetical protein